MDNEILRQRLAEGLELAKKGDYAGARAVLEALSLEAPESIEAHYYLGLACKRTQDLAAARAAWERCLALDPFYHQARTQLAALGPAGQPDFLSDAGTAARFFGETAETRMVQPAPLFSRALAFFIDSFLFSFAAAPFLAIFFLSLMGKIGSGDPVEWISENANLVQVGVTAITFVVQLVFIPFFTYESGMTPGKRLLGMRIVDASTLQPLTPVQAVGRFLASFLSSCAFYLGYVVGFFNRERRTLHDYLAGTIVAASSSVPMTGAEKAMTALTIILAIVGGVMTVIGMAFLVGGLMETFGSSPFLPF